MKFKNYVLVLLVTIFLAVSNVSANTINISLENLEITGTELTAFQFKLLDDGISALPVDTDYVTFDNDFFVTFGASVPNKNGWEGDSLIKSIGDIDFARGFYAFAKTFSSALSLNDGLLVTIESVNTNFAVDLGSFEFFDLTSQPITDFNVYSIDSANVMIDFNPVPIPSSLLLLSGGLFALVGITRRKK